MLRLALLTAVAVGTLSCASQASAQNFNGTCTNVHYEGPRLVAVCLNALGVPNASSIDIRTCRPSDVGNANGNLVCAGGSGYRRGPAYGYGGDEDDAPPPYYRRRYGY